MTPTEACEYAASWGSYVRGGDPGACMYGFSEDCRPQSEEHRQQVIAHVENVCRPIVERNPGNYADDELDQMAAFLDFIRNRTISPDTEGEQNGTSNHTDVSPGN